MISFLRGEVIALQLDTVVVAVGGVGLTVRVTPAEALQLRLGGEAQLHTALIVREDELSLYGFATVEELEVFDLLRGVSGVGPKSAIGVLGELSPVEVARAVADEDEKPFRRVSGIGPKTAKLILLSLSGKLAAPVMAAPSDAVPLGGRVTDSVVAALVGLGWPERSARQAADDAVAEAGTGSGDATLLRQALARLASTPETRR